MQATVALVCRQLLCQGSADAAAPAGSSPLRAGRSCGRCATSGHARRRLPPLRAGRNRPLLVQGALATASRHLSSLLVEEGATTAEEGAAGGKRLEATTLGRAAQRRAWLGAMMEVCQRDGGSYSGCWLGLQQEGHALEWEAAIAMLLFTIMLRPRTTLLGGAIGDIWWQR
ncbi:hypothetical protein GW17_00016805 [Ensete ventricosum]|nr:hypothetical protein GW17_00016805 [Ensete ventricosum]